MVFSLLALVINHTGKYEGWWD